MKKSLLLFVGLFAMTFGALAQTKTFTDSLIVTVDGFATDPQEAKIDVDMFEDGTCNLSLKNFCLIVEGEVAPVGNILLEGVKTTNAGLYKLISTKQEIKITEGDLEGMTDWMGPMLQEVPIDLKGKLFGNKFYCTIAIDMVSLGQVINVQFGTPENLYQDELVVTVDGFATDSQQAEIAVETLGDGTCNLSLKNFCLIVEGDVAPVGNILLEGVKMVEESGYYVISTQQDIKITEGDLEGMTDWMGPMLQEVPIDLKGKITADKLYCTIAIDMVSLGQVINVQFGDEMAVGINQYRTECTRELVNVYSLQGTLIRTNIFSANVLDGLPKGLYIVNGKKIVK